MMITRCDNVLLCAFKALTEALSVTGAILRKVMTLPRVSI